MKMMASSSCSVRGGEGRGGGEGGGAATAEARTEISAILAGLDLPVLFWRLLRRRRKDRKEGEEGKEEGDETLRRDKASPNLSRKVGGRFEGERGTLGGGEGARGGEEEE
jgi:hypothetical protein